MTNSITIKTKDKGKRLDIFLTENLSDITRSQIKKLIKNEQIFVNDKNTTVHYFIKEGDKIEIRETSEKIEEEKPEITPEDNSKLFKEIKIIEENKNFLIIEKPAGLLVHATERNETDTLVDWLLEKYPEMRQIGEDPQRPAIVHRLDKDVSGLMIIPRNQNSFDYFKSQFKLRTLTKKYTALVYGETEKNHDEINFPIGRSKTKQGLFAAHPPQRGEAFSEKDKNAITEFEVVKRFKNYTLIEVQIHTGRTHQIRVHLTAYGYPIVGDKLYFHKNLKTRKQLDRVFLHAHYLSFIGPDEKKYKFESKLPKKLNDFLKSLKEIQ